MENETRVLVVALLIVSLGVAVVWLKPSVDERLAPEPIAAWVAIAAGEGPEDVEVADIGPVVLAAGEPFRLYAVLEARDRQGRSVYYTEAPALRFTAAGASDESTTVPDAAVRRWDRLPHVKVRWFTVEGPQPFFEVDAADLASFGLRTYYRPDWPNTWSLPGVVDAAFDNHLDRGEATDRAPPGFGTQRFHVRIELYANDKTTLPQVRIASWAAEALPDQVARFPTVIATLPGSLAPASRVFGLTQLALQPPSSSESVATLRRLAAQGLAFDRLTVLGDLLRESGVALDDQVWESVDLGSGLGWPAQAGAGDLLRVGERVVVLFADRGTIGVVDYDDLCLDFVRGAVVRRLGDVFSGEGLVVELQRLPDDVLP